MKSSIALVSSLLFSTIIAGAQDKPSIVMEQPQDGPYAPSWESLSAYETPEWFKDAKFGIWAHWGPQCQPEAGDWYAREMYYDGTRANRFHRAKYGDPSEFGFKDIINTWQAEKWNPDSLVALYKRVGARYFMALANHHDNLDLWDSKYHNWNSVNVGPHKDLLAGWRQAAINNGLPFGISIHASHAWSWYEGSQKYDGNLTSADGLGTWWEGLNPYELYAQKHPLSDKADDVGTIHAQWKWGGGVCPPSLEFMAEVYNRTLDAVHSYNPDVIYFDDIVLPFYPYNESLGLNIAADFYNHNIAVNGTQHGVILGKQLSAEQKQCLTWDVERGVPDKIQSDYWQTCTCIGNWHYDRDVYEKGRYKDARYVICMLVDVVSKNGNLLLSVPLPGNGMPDEKELAILDDITRWLDVNGESIYGTRPWKVCGEGPTVDNAKPIEGFGFNEKFEYSARDVRYVTKDGNLYATVLGQPDSTIYSFTMLGADGPLAEAGVDGVELLGFGPLDFNQTTDCLSVKLPDSFNDDIAWVFKISLK